jgi:hypothetical protein
MKLTKKISNAFVFCLAIYAFSGGRAPFVKHDLSQCNDTMIARFGFDDQECGKMYNDWKFYAMMFSVVLIGQIAFKKSASSE